MRKLQKERESTEVEAAKTADDGNAETKKKKKKKKRKAEEDENVNACDLAMFRSCHVICLRVTCRRHTYSPLAIRDITIWEFNGDDKDEDLAPEAATRQGQNSEATVAQQWRVTCAPLA